MIQICPPGKNYETILDNEECRIDRVWGEEGSGTSVCYRIFPGVMVTYSDYHMKACDYGFSPDCDILCIDYCKEGRIEQEIENGAFSFFEEGDLKVGRRIYHTGHAEFPLHCFKGMTILCQMEEASRSIADQIKGFPVDLYEIQRKYCNDKHPFVIPNEAGVMHIFSEMYQLPERFKRYYLEVKILELLLYLDRMEVENKKEERPYFYKFQVEKVKAIHRLLTENISRHYTLQELSAMFELPLTAMKSCFKAVYGDSVFAYMRKYRMKRAAKLLLQDGELNVAQIAGLMGYDSPGKFSTAFKAVMGMTPLKYKKENRF